MVNTLSGYRQYSNNQTTDGTNDYYSGINGTNGFSITPFAGVAGMTFSILVNFGATINSATSQKRLFEIADSTRTNLLAFDIGAFSGTLTDEYMGVSLVTGTTKSGARLSNSETIPNGWHHLCISVGSGAGVVPFIVRDGVSFTATNNAFGPPLTATSTFTANKVGLMASSSGSVPTGATWREAFILNEALSIANAQLLYNYYTRNGNVPIEKSNRTAAKFYVTPTARAKIVALWSGNESGTDLKDRFTAASDLTKTNF